MEGFQLTPVGVGFLAEFTLNLIFAGYLLRLPNKSRDGKLILGLAIVHFVDFGIGFLEHSTYQLPWNQALQYARMIDLNIVHLYVLWFTYSYRHHPFQKEMRWVVIITCLIIGFSTLYELQTKVVSIRLILFVCIHIWGLIVYVRKAAWAKGLVYQGKTSLQDIEAFRAFARLGVLPVIMFALFSLAYANIIGFWAVRLPVHALILIWTTWLFINFIHYASEPTTFLVKLVGLFHCLTMILLGTCAFMFVDYGLGEQQAHSILNIVAILILATTFVNIVIIPIFFQKNLLGPLNNVLKGVQRINSGDLTTEVPVTVQDEIGSVTRQFNQMARSLYTYSQEMESLVSERTAELQQQKEELLTTLEQLKAAQVQLKQLDAQKTRFFDNITHEFRTPLTLILVPVEHLLSNLNNSSPHYPYLQSIDRNARHLLRLINQLLDLSRLESDSIPRIESRGNIVQFTRQIIEAFRPAAEQKGIRFTSHLDPIIGEHVFDIEKWEKIVTNLLSNALKFTPVGGEIKVYAHLEAQDVFILQVSDTGIGISAEKLPHIFNRFYQADDSRTRAFEGSGIGLALVKELTCLLAGRVEVQSKEREGTTFTIVLPLTRATGEEEPLPALPAIPEIFSAGLSISEDGKETKPLLLIVEDNAEMSAFISQTLSAFYRILTASNGREGLAIAHREMPDIVVSDVMMPEMDGLAFCEALKTDPHTNHIAVLLLTARASQNSRLEGLYLGADDYITKPFNLEELGLRLRNLLDRQQKLREYYLRQWQGTEALPVERNVKDAFVEKLYAIIEHNLDNSGFDPEMLACEVAMSVRTLNRKLNTLMGISAAKLIRVYRLKKAVALLQTGHSVSDTAYQVGFESPSYFATAFKEYYQKTPSEFVAI